MQHKIRKSIFETNSSSSHSLSLGQLPNNLNPVEDNYETIVLGTGDYGWGYDTLNTWLEKADYLSIETEYNETRKNCLESAIKRYFPNITIEYEYTGYIDHQSYGNVWDEIGYDVDEVCKVIFGSSTIEIDDDSH